LPERTIDIIRRRAEDCGIPAFGDLAEFKMREGMVRFGPENHLGEQHDWLREALDELADAWAYLCIIERRGGRIPEELWTSLAVTAGMLLMLRDANAKPNQALFDGRQG